MNKENKPVGQILLYRYNGLYNSKPGVDRNLYSIKTVLDKTQFRTVIEDSLDEVPPGKGYALVKWGNKMFVCEKDINNPTLNYVRHEVGWHPLANVFTI